MDNSFRSLSVVAVHRAHGFAIVSILFKGIVYDRRLAIGNDRYVVINPDFANK